MIDEIDRRTLMGADKEDAGDRRQPLFWLLWALLIFFVLFGCGQTAMWFDSGGLEDVEIRSGLTVDYGIWTPVAFGGINPLIIAEAAGDNGGVIILASIPSNSCFLLGNCTPNPPPPTPTATSTPTVTSMPTNTPTPSNTPTATNTWIPTYTPTASDTPTITPTPTNTPTPTPRVYPVKIAYPYKIPPGAAPVTIDYKVMVINWGSIPPAELTLICDFLPADMTYVPGSANQGGTFGSCPDPDGSLTGAAIYWQFSPPLIIAQGGFTLPSFTFQAYAQNTIAGQVLTNEVHTWGNNIETAVFYRPIYVFTPTPTSTPTGAPTANDDFYSTNEDTPLVISDPNSSAPVGGVLGNDVDLLWNGIPDVLTAQVISGPSSGILNMNPDGTFTFTPELNTNGLVTFSYRACDAGSLCDIADVEITVISIPDAPIARDDPDPDPSGPQFEINEDGILWVVIPGVLWNDTDGDGDPIIAVTPQASGPSNGSLTLYDTGNIFYVPDPDFSGVDTFTYYASDGTLTSNLATVDITVLPVNDPPVAEVNSYGTAEDTALNVAAPGVLGNDSDVDNAPTDLSAVLDSSVSNGALTLNPNGSFDYIPDPDFNGIDSFTYHANDGADDSNIVTVTITVNPVNDQPNAFDDDSSTDEDTPVVIIILANDPMGNNPLPSPGDGMGSVVVTSGPANGTTVVNGDNTITYTPDPDYFSPIVPPVVPDEFTYRLCDIDGPPDCDTATVRVTVNAVNDPPVAVADPQVPTLYEVNEDDALGLSIGAPGVLANDTDVEGDPLTAVLDADVSDGTLTLDANGSFVYVPDADFNGTDTFTYHANDGADDSNIATVTITVNSQNDTPAAVDDPVSTDEDTPIPIDVLANDWMGNNPPPAPGDGVGSLVVVLASGPTNGTATVNDNSTPADVSDDLIDYAPNGDWSGVDTFEYEVCDVDGLPDCDTAIVTVTVNAVNDPPVAADDPEAPTVYVVDEDNTIAVPVLIGVLANDTDVESDPLMAVLDADVSDGTLVLNPDGSFDYTPDADFNGNDTFTYYANDGTDDSLVAATVTITVNPVNDVPVANDDTPTTDEDIPIIIDVLANDVMGDDPAIGDGVLSVVPLAGPTTMGTVAPAAGYQVQYTSPLDWSGTDTFTYTVTDTNGDSASATVTVTVNSVNDPPVAVDDPEAPTVYEVNEDPLSPLVVPVLTGVLANDTDIESDPLTAVLDADVSDGTLTLNPDGSFDYIPDPDFNGTDTFTYHANDGAGDSNIATVSITVNPINDTPIAVDDGGPLFSVNEDVGLMMFFIPGVLGNDTGIGDTPLTLTVVAGPSDGGLLSLGNSGGFGYNPAADYFGITTFDYRVTDLDGQWSEATVTITVNEVNDPPTAVDDDDGDGAFVNEDGSVTIDVLANDFDGDPPPIFDILSVQSVTDPPNGIAVTNVSDVTYTPDADFYGTDTFQYTVSDGRGGTDTATVTVRVDPVNDTPVAVDDGGPLFNVNEDVGLMMFFIPGVLGNDTGIGDTPLTLTVVAGPSDGGLLSLGNSGGFGYNPAFDHNGVTTFDYRVTDLDGQWSEATVTITVNPVDDLPDAVDDNPSTDEDTTVVIDVLANDPMGNNAPPAPGDGLGSMVSAVISGVTQGSIVDVGNQVEYTPPSDWSGLDSFTYTLCDADPSPDCDTATVTVTVNPVNDAPVAGPDGPFSVAEDGTLNVPSVTYPDDLLANDNDVEGDPLTAQLVSGPANAAPLGFTLNPDGSFDYTPATDYRGTDTFSYRAYDGNLTSNLVTVNLNVTPVNDVPVANADPGYSTDEDTTLNVSSPGVLSNDTDLGDILLTLTVVATPPPSEGTISLNNDGSFSFVPALDFNGPTTFGYTITDSDALPPEISDTSPAATVTITVNPVNDAPVAGPDGPFSVAEDDTLSVPSVIYPDDLLVNDSDVEGDPLTAQLVSGPANAAPLGFTLNPDGSFDYTPATDYRGTDTFSYRAYDGNLTSNLVTVNLNVTPVNDVPVANADPGYSTDEDTTLNVSAPGVLNNDSDLGDIPLTLTLVATPLPSEGTVSLNNDGSFSFVPAAEYNGTTTFQYEITDSGALPPEISDTSPAATVTITVNPVNDAPVAVDDPQAPTVFAVNEDALSPLVVPAPGVLSNDYDVDGDPFSSNLISNVSNGTLALGLDGSFTYMPNSNFNGTDSFTYEICDPSPVCSSADVTIVVNPVPDPQMFISVSPSDVTLNPPEVFTFDVLFGNSGPGTAYGIVVSGAVVGDCTLLTPNPIITSGSMNQGAGLLTTADVQALAPGGACTFTATITSTNGTTANDSAEINRPITMWAPFSSRAMASTGSNGTIEAAIAFLIPVAMLVTPFILSWWGKVKRTSRPR